MCRLTFLAVALTVVAAPAALAQQHSYSRVDVSSPTDISDNGTIIESFSGTHFVRKRRGSPVPFSVAGATVVLSLTGINSQEIVTGNLILSGLNYPFIATTDGLHWRALPRVDGLNTNVNAISNNGKVFGNRSAPGFPSRGVIIDTRHGDEVTYVDYPGAASTTLLGGNDNGFLFGRATGPGAPPFWSSRNGQFEPLVFAPEVGPDAVTLGSDTNNRGDLLVSWRSPIDGTRRAGIQSANGNFQEIVYPDLGAIALAESQPTFLLGFILYHRVPNVTNIQPNGINERGDVVGSLGQGYSETPGAMAVLYRSLSRGFVAEKGAGGNLP